MKRAKGIMSMELSKKIIDNAKALKSTGPEGVPGVSDIIFTGLGETLMDPYLVARIRYVRQIDPLMSICIFTNGHLLSHSTIDTLKDAGLTGMYVSLNATNFANRQAIMNLRDYNQVCEAIDYARKIKLRAIVTASGNGGSFEAGEDKKFFERWAPDVCMHWEGNWAGNLWPMKIIPNNPCVRALDQLMVLWDGRVSLCCFDGEGECILGDLNTQTIEEVYHGEKATKIRQYHETGRRKDLALCRNCTGI